MSAVTFTLTADEFTFVKVLIPCLPETLDIALNDPGDPTYLMRAEALVRCQSYRRQPELGRAAPPLDVDVGRLPVLQTVKEEPKLSDAGSAERLRLLPAPWDIPTPASVIAGIPTLVVTGGWNEEFEEIASALVRGGATHRQLTGFGHRVPDHPEANSLIRDWAKQH